MFKKFIANESGATAIEYGLIAMLVGVACVGAFVAIGGGLGGIFNTAAVAVTPE